MEIEPSPQPRLAWLFAVVCGVQKTAGWSDVEKLGPLRNRMGPNKSESKVRAVGVCGCRTVAAGGDRKEADDNPSKDSAI